RRLRAVESHPGQIQTAHEGIDEANRIVFSDIILDRFGKEHDLLSTDAAYVIHQRCSFLIALTNVDDDTNFKCQSFHTVCRWTRPAGACFVTNLVRRCLNEFAPPRQLRRWVASPFSLTNFKHAPRIEACVVNASGRK